MKKPKFKPRETFEDYLMDIYIRSENPLDDDIPDGFADWIADSDPNDLIEYAERWGKKLLTK